MKSKAAIGNHPIHPMLVPIPIGAFTLAILGDVMHSVSPRDPFWYDFSYSCIGFGILFAVLAAAVGAIDYLGVHMSSKAFRIATWHAVTNVCVLLLFGISFFLRRSNAAMSETRWPIALAFGVVGFVLLGVSGWLGGKLAYEHRVGVIERPDAAPVRATNQRAAS
jgi:uncharacterized membrane protein